MLALHSLERIGMTAIDTYTIVEVDRDYRVVTGVETKVFESKEAAEQYAREKSWTGYDYYVE
jgi:hypothetical protein